MPIMMPVILLVKMSSATMMIMSNNLKDACHHSSNIGQHRQHQWDAWQSFHLNFELASFAHDDDDNVDGGGGYMVLGVVVVVVMVVVVVTMKIMVTCQLFQRRDRRACPQMSPLQSFRNLLITLIAVSRW